MKVINVNDIDNMLGEINLIDIREPYETTMKALSTSENIPMAELLGSPTEHLNKEDTYYIICQSGGRSAMACNMLEDLGYDVINVSGGTGSYVGPNLK